MQIVIDIDDKLYEIIKNPKKLETMYHAGRLCEAVRKGQVLPKGHGALKDADKLLETWYDDFCEFMTQTELDSMNNIIKNAPTIIEADREDEK